MADAPDTTDADQPPRTPPARSNPGLVVDLLSHCLRLVHTTRVVLSDEPASRGQGVAYEHLMCAQDHLRRAEAQFQQCLRAFILPDGPPPSPALPPEAQDTLDTVLATRDLPQP